ncbi:hypothetical protein DL770_011500 [Monosporascus sp. CRB-9-2]|nr:hypothetical protein DL770_011500 [Monosporascus sp. CRB-9-2]
MHTPVLLFALLPNKGPGMAACLAQPAPHLRKVKVGGSKKGLTLWRLDPHNQIRAMLQHVVESSGDLGRRTTLNHPANDVHVLAQRRKVFHGKVFLHRQGNQNAEAQQHGR